MCGVAGICRFDGVAVDPADVQAMIATLRHRGPDSEGLVVEGPVGIGHTRLSIIDLAGSRQPMTSPDGRFVLTFNGEIFNYRQLRSELRHHPFLTQGDTEVVLATMSRHGPEGAARFVGQFAFAMHDRTSGTTWLVRDHVGVLPLYYYIDEYQLVFGSEVEALLQVVGEHVTLDRRQLRSYLKGRAVHAPDTLLAGVRKVLPGHVVAVSRRGEVASFPFWTLPEPSAVLDLTPAQSVDAVNDCLIEAVDSAMVADVPVGAYLSGGVDSSLIVALATQSRTRAGTSDPIATFAAEFGDERVDETTYSGMVSAEFRTDHHRVRVRPDNFRERWELLTRHRGAPISEPSDIAVAELAVAARQHVKVVLSGEGSDELFGGYPKYRYAHLTTHANRLPDNARIAAARFLERALPARLGRVRIATRAFTGNPSAKLEDWFAPFTDYECDQLLGESVFRPAREIEGRDPIDLMARLDFNTWLPDNLLERGDRMSMSASLELRPPFLDHRLVELAFRLPSSVKVRGAQTKWVVKEVARRYLPAAVVDRPKVGFKVPLDSWFRGDLEELARDLLTGPSSFVASTLDARVVERLLDDHRSGRRDEQIRIWTLLSLEVWGRQVFSSPRLTPGLAR
jgi:asparagine synthase (glutamine-hydrolysing)